MSMKNSCDLVKIVSIENGDLAKKKTRERGFDFVKGDIQQAIVEPGQWRRTL